MTRYCLIAAIALGTASGATAQYQFPPSVSAGGAYYQNPTVMPNIFNPQNQPLSPYLNLLRGGNPATNYYYGVRPGTVGGTGLGIGAPFTAFGGNRPLFFPQLASAPEPFADNEPTGNSLLPPAGHPVVFNNTMGYFPSPFGYRGGAGGGGYGGNRPGLSGAGPTRSQPKK